MAENSANSSMSEALQETVAKDQTVDIEATEVTEGQLPTLLSETLHIDEAKGGSDPPLTSTPSTGSNASSPVKHDHREDPQFDQVQIMHGSSQGTHGAPRIDMANPGIDLLTQIGINSSYLTTAQLELFQAQSLQVQAKTIQVYAHNMLIQEKRQSMLQPKTPNPGLSSMQPGMNAGMPDFYNGETAIQTNPSVQSNRAGNRALLDYHMQLVLLDLQNMQQIMMARQELNKAGTIGPVTHSQPVIKSKI